MDTQLNALYFHIGNILLNAPTPPHFGCPAPQETNSAPWFSELRLPDVCDTEKERNRQQESSPAPSPWESPGTGHRAHRSHLPTADCSWGYLLCSSCGFWCQHYNKWELYFPYFACLLETQWDLYELRLNLPWHVCPTFWCWFLLGLGMPSLLKTKQDFTNF